MCACSGLQSWHYTLKPCPETWTLLIPSLYSTSKDTPSVLTYWLLPTLSVLTVRTREQTFSLHFVPLSPAELVSDKLALDSDAFPRKLWMRVIVDQSPLLNEEGAGMALNTAQGRHGFWFLTFSSEFSLWQSNCISFLLSAQWNRG